MYCIYIIYYSLQYVTQVENRQTGHSAHSWILTVLQQYIQYTVVHTIRIRYAVKTNNLNLDTGYNTPGE